MNVLERHLGGDRLRLVDVGARGGIAPRWDRFVSVLDVTAFEPDTAECDRLNRGAGSLAYPIRYLPTALWRESAEEIPFYITNWPVASSVRQPNSEFLRSFPEAERLFGVRQVETIAVTTLDDVARREGVVADCLKVDVEGAALDVLVGAEDTLRETLVLEVEAEVNPVFTGEALFATVDTHLRERGWALLGLRRTSWRRSAQPHSSGSGFGGQLISVDALYFNQGLIGGGLSLPDELKLLVALSAYLQMDSVRARLESSGAIAGALSAAEIDELQRLLTPRPGPIARLARRAAGRWNSAQRRLLADRMQGGNATTWEDPHFF